MRREDPTFGRYEILDEIGRGSMAIVHKAHDPVEDRDVAIKRILWPNGVPPERWVEFHRKFHEKVEEAERLSHPAIVSVYGVEDNAEDGTPFIAMEYVPGPTLHELIRKEGALDPDWALTVTDTLADALQSAHDAGIVHPDFKPANILVRESDGAAKIADFGVLHMTEPSGAGLTHGTPAYLSPECILGEPADIRSELFSLAVILYEMLCGEPPFGGVIAELVRESILHLPPTPISSRSCDLSPAFDEFFERALSKRPGDRYQDAAAFREAIASLRERQSEYEPDPESEAAVDAAADEEAGSEDFDCVSAVDLGAGAADETDTHFGYEIDPSLGATVDAPPVGEPAVVPPVDVDRPAERDDAPLPLLDVGTATLPSEPAIEPRPARERRRPSTEPFAGHAPRSPWARILWYATAVVLLVLFAVAIAWVWGVSSTPDPTPPEPAYTLPEFDFATALEDFAATPIEPVAEPEPPAPAPVKAKPPAPKPKKVVKKAAPAPVAKPEPPAPVVEVASPVEAPPPVEEPVVDVVEVATVGVLVKNSFKESVLTLYVDGSQVYTAALSKADREAATDLEIPVGPHRITAHVLNVAKKREYEESVEVELAPGDERTLRIVAGKTFGSRVKLTFE